MIEDDEPFNDNDEIIEHKVIGVCKCGEPAHTTDAYGNISCYPCAYDTAF